MSYFKRVIVVATVLFGLAGTTLAGSPSIADLQTIMEKRCAVLKDVQFQIKNPTSQEAMASTGKWAWQSFIDYWNAVNTFSYAELSTAEIQQATAILQKMKRCNDKLDKIIGDWVKKFVKLAGSNSSVVRDAPHDRDRAQAAAKLAALLKEMKKQ